MSLVANAPTYDSFHLPTYSYKQKKPILKYIKQILDAQQHMLHLNHNNILQYTLEQTVRHQWMKHYPKGDRIDHRHGGQYFYHCHRDNQDTNEHGHFHCFLRQIAIPKAIQSIPHQTKPTTHPMTHLVAISMNRYGQPIRLFTVNRWVADDIWYRADDMPQLIQKFKLDIQDQSPWYWVDQWIEGILHVFAPQIVWLHQQRTLCHFDTEDKTLEELTSIGINLTEQIHWIIG